MRTGFRKQTRDRLIKIYRQCGRAALRRAKIAELQKDPHKMRMHLDTAKREFTECSKFILGGHRAVQ